MNKKIFDLLEQHVDKLIFGVVGILCLWLLWAFVLGNPYSVEYNNQKFGPDELDRYIEERQVRPLQSKLEKLPETREYVGGRSEEFTAEFACSISEIDDNAHFPIPDFGIDVMVDDRTYVLPPVGEVGDVSVEFIRTAAFVPLEEVNYENPYRSAAIEVGDIDFVTVQSSFDLAVLYKSFRQNFAGPRVKADWRDESLAKPLFAAVQLQRQELLVHGKWADWQVVPRTNVDSFKKMVAVPQKVEQVKYGVNLLMAQLSDINIQRGVIQPIAYKFAASNEQWFVPSLHKKFVTIMEREMERAGKVKYTGAEESGESRRPARQGDRSSMRRSSTDSRARREGSRGTRRRPAPTTRIGQKDRVRDKTKGSPGMKAKTIEDISDEQEKLWLDEKSGRNPTSRREPLVFWAHDDTTHVGKTYRYRIRLGVFNPIAGRDWFRDDQKQFKDEVILWSDYSDVTEAVRIPEILHFWPVDVAVGRQKSVTIEVSKFYLGKWRGEKFDVLPGEMIGKQTAIRARGDDQGQASDYSGTLVEVVDFGTGAVLVDVVERNDWAGVNVLHPRKFSEILYTRNGLDIEHLAVKSRNWSKKLQGDFSRIKEAESKKVILLGVESAQMGIMPGTIRKK